MTDAVARRRMSSPPGASPTPVASIDADCSNDKTLDAHPALFSIPTHATTHASSAEYLDASVGESLPTLGLQGRPQPTLTVGTDDVDSADQPLRPTHTLTQRNNSTTASRRSTVTPAHKSDEALRNGPPMLKASVHVEETPFPTLIADATSAPPDYHKHLYPTPSTARNVVNEEDPLPPPLAVAGQQGGGGRFPRWRGWLEKRALERHFERLDAGDISSQDADVKRKKSWGAGVDDDDALSDAEEQDEVRASLMRAAACMCSADNCAIHLGRTSCQRQTTMHCICTHLAVGSYRTSPTSLSAQST